MNKLILSILCFRVVNIIDQFRHWIVIIFWWFIRLSIIPNTINLLSILAVFSNSLQSSFQPFYPLSIFIFTFPDLQASVAIVLDLKIRTLQSHLSIRTFLSMFEILRRESREDGRQNREKILLISSLLSNLSSLFCLLYSVFCPLTSNSLSFWKSVNSGKLRFSFSIASTMVLLTI